jgi:hypothetical protein
MSEQFSEYEHLKQKVVYINQAICKPQELKSEMLLQMLWQYVNYCHKMSYAVGKCEVCVDISSNSDCKIKVNTIFSYTKFIILMSEFIFWPQISCLKKGWECLGYNMSLNY